MVDVFEQRQVVDRVRIERRFHIVPAELALCQPLLYAGDFALTEGRRSLNLAGKPMTLWVAGQIDRNQFGYPKGNVLRISFPSPI